MFPGCTGQYQKWSNEGRVSVSKPVGCKDWPVCASPTGDWLKLSLVYVDAGSDRNVLEHTACRSLLHMELHSSKDVHADSCLLPKRSPVDTWASGQDDGEVGEGAFFE